MTGVVVENEIRPISHRSTNDKVLEIVLPLLEPGVRVADIGAGEGFFSQLLGEHVKSKLRLEPAEVITACDIFPEYFGTPTCRASRFSPDGRLPYDDESINIACSLEVIEHVEDQFASRASPSDSSAGRTGDHQHAKR
jgi:2-polyprenyl-3-methyl-5-hydroxy-6-metoxy-1,4-benzoquinol methylase